MGSCRLPLKFVALKPVNNIVFLSFNLVFPSFHLFGRLILSQAHCMSTKKAFVEKEDEAISSCTLQTLKSMYWPMLHTASPTVPSLLTILIRVNFFLCSM